MVEALNVANSILYRAFNENIDITPMKMQKMIYLVYKSYYKRTDKKLFDEKFEVWKYGPVLPSVYDAFKVNGANAIREYHKESNGSVFVVNEDTSRNFKDVLDLIWNKYKHYDGIRLSEMTHRKNTAWWKAVQRKDKYLDDQDISKEENYVK